MDLFKEIWQIYRKDELRNRTWWWWWWLFVFKNPEDPDGKEKQLMVLWATRNSKKIWVDDYKWERKAPPVDDEKGSDFEGVAAAWYYDGDKMHDPVLIDSGKGRIEGNDTDGFVSIKGKNGEYMCMSDMGGDQWSIYLKDNNGVDIQASTVPYDKVLSKIVPTGKNYVGKLSYKMYKIKRVNCEGKVNLGDGKGFDAGLEGTAYFQNVRINSPTSPWYWAFLHSQEGFYIDYFVPHFGLPMLRRRYKHKSPLDRGWLKLSRGLHIIDPRDGKEHRIKKFKVKQEYRNDLPIFHIYGEEDGKSIDMEVTTYSRACWKIKQPWLGIFSTMLYYNEYPCHVTKLEFKDGDKTITLSDTGKVWGNCEHAWGII